MDLPAGELDELRRLLLGSSDRWDDGELAAVLIAGLPLSVIEASVGLIRLPWPAEGPGMSTAQRAQRRLSTMIESGDDANWRALKALTDTRKPTTTRLTEVAEMFGRTTSRTGRNRLKHEILPWFFDHLIASLQNASDELKASNPRRPPQASLSIPVEFAPLADPGTYRAEFRSPIDPSQLAQALKDRYLQVALDLGDLNAATRIAQLAATNGADLIEVGDPLIKRYGIDRAVEQIRSAVPGIPLVVEFASSDWVDEQIEMAADAGADLVYVLGLDQPSRIERAVRCARNRRVGFVPAIPSHVDVAKWCANVESAGADAISIIRNIDSAQSLVATTARMRQVADVANVPLVISGGFAPGNLNEIIADDWSIVVVGGAIINAREPGAVVRSLRERLDVAA